MYIKRSCILVQYLSYCALEGEIDTGILNGRVILSSLICGIVSPFIISIRRATKMPQHAHLHTSILYAYDIKIIRRLCP